MSKLSGTFSVLKGRRIIIALLFLFLLLSGSSLLAQNPLGRFGNMGGGGGGGKGDTLVHRKADTITINFRYLDSSRLLKLDSSILDVGRKIPRPATWINLGNMGTPARNLVFSPRMQSGWDPGWHAFDIYRFTVDETKFFNTTKPYTELGYMLAARGEQFVNVFHTQNVRSNWNFSFEYRLLNSPGTFQNQNTNHANIRLGSWYQSKNKRYQNFFVLVSNKLAASENGGIQSPADLDSAQYSNQATIPVKLGNGIQQATGNIFSAPITTGTRYSSSTYMMRQQYDLGQKDSIVTDTSVTPLFYPRVRLEHTVAYSSYRYRFFDFNTPFTYPLDSSYYKDNYGLTVNPGTDSVYLQDTWKVFSNDFSIYQFPDSKNPQQFIKLGATLELLKGSFDSSLTSQNPITNHQINTQNVFAHGEYRNKTRNQKWDIEAFGRLYLNGLNSGDYNAYISLRRLISRQIGYFQAGFENANRTPGYVYDRASSFYLDTANNKSGFSKENITHLFASLDQPQHQLSLTGSYYLMTNYSYFSDYSKEHQSSVFNLLQISIKKQFTLYRHWKWRTLTYIQQTAGSSPVHVPLITSTNQIGYDGNLGFRSLNISFGTEIRYVSPYKADGYAPVTGQFF
ncbi:MAG TPA: putative porin, partial [Chitinophagaceae bacterium]|nr:putative porin [Chitinophagaceae bacterium]